MASGLPDLPSHGGSQLDDVLASTMPSSFGAGAGVLLPTEQPSRTGLYVGLAAGGVFLLGLTAALVFLLTREPERIETVRVIDKGGDDSDKSGEEGDEESASDKKPKDAASAAPTGDRAGTEAAGHEDPKGATPGKPGKRPPGPGKKPAADVDKPGTSPGPGPTDGKPAKPVAHKDELDELLGGALTKKGDSKPAPAADPKPGPAPDPKPALAGPPKLEKGTVGGVLGSAKGRMSKCSALGTGTVTAVLKIGGSGSVSSVDIKPPHDSQPVGKCVAGIIMGLKFPANDGTTPPVTYPVILK